MKLIDSPFDVWAKREGCDIAPAVSPVPARTCVDRDTQAVFDAWNSGAASVARMLTESTLETDPLRELICKLTDLE
jgi:hypothetical protein